MIFTNEVANHFGFDKGSFGLEIKLFYDSKKKQKRRNNCTTPETDYENCQQRQILNLSVQILLFCFQTHKSSRTSSFVQKLLTGQRVNLSPPDGPVTFTFFCFCFICTLIELVIFTNEVANHFGFDKGSFGLEIKLFYDSKKKQKRRNNCTTPETDYENCQQRQILNLSVQILLFCFQTHKSSRTSSFVQKLLTGQRVNLSPPDGPVTFTFFCFCFICTLIELVIFTNEVANHFGFDKGSFGLEIKLFYDSKKKQKRRNNCTTPETDYENCQQRQILNLSVQILLFCFQTHKSSRTSSFVQKLLTGQRVNLSPIVGTL